jgi:EAL domain-containing protein (putative c-di-GMP-specific phosphodiesterase class I)
MSMMINAPTIATAGLGWRQVFGFGQGRDPFFARARAAQLQSINRYVPFNTLLISLDVVERAMKSNGIDPARLEFEITESLFLDEKASTIEKLAALKALGVRLALDDFGTGYSSLGYLHKAAFSRIKIDRSFVSRPVQPNGEASAIIQAIVSLAHSLEMTTTAEGTETREEFERCRALGCEQVQGYLFGKPMPPEEATALVRPRAKLRIAAE